MYFCLSKYRGKIIKETHHSSQPTFSFCNPELKIRRGRSKRRKRYKIQVEMRGRSSSKRYMKEEMEIDSKLGSNNSNEKLKDETHLSGAYIRSLVKQLTSSRTKDHSDHCVVDGDANSVGHKKLTKFSEKNPETQKQQTQQQPQQHKKQVRRRLHTSRPYQERLLNMAEARREIVTALKYHRAAMKQASEQQQQQKQLSRPPLQLPDGSCFEQEGKAKSRRNPRIYPSNLETNFSNYLENLPYSSYPYHPPPSPPPPLNPYSWTASQVTSTTPYISEPLNFALPNQTLGLNLNLHDFNTIDSTPIFHHNSSNTVSSLYSSASPSSSASPPLSFGTDELPSVAMSQEVGGPPVDALESSGGSGLHQAMDDEEMAEIKSMGEQHEMEWNDTMNLVTSAWWFKFLKTMEIGPEEMKGDDDGYHPFGEVMEFPSWLNANESCLEQHFSDYCPDAYSQDAALPCMDIGEIDGMDSEWLA